MVKTSLPNSSYSFKTIRKVFFGLSYVALLTCSAQASKNILDQTEDFFNQKFVQFKDKVHDMSKRVERVLRPSPSNFLDRAHQKALDLCEDADDMAERKIIRSIKNWIE